MNRCWAIIITSMLLLSCQKPAIRESIAQSSAVDSELDGPREVSSAYIAAKTLFTPLPAPRSLRVVQVNPTDNRQLMEITALQGLINRRCPDSCLIYLEGKGFPDSDWRRYYASQLNLEIIQITPLELLDWARQNTDIRYYIIVDPSTSSDDMDASHACTINLANTLAGIVGNAIPVQPQNVPILQAHGYSLLPDTYCDSLGVGDSKLHRPGAFDLRNQWKSTHPDAPWKNRQQAYKWALDVLAPLTNHQSITLNYGKEAFNDNGVPEQFEPWINDYPIANRQFIFYLNPSVTFRHDWDKTRYDRKFYHRLLDLAGPFTMIRGWHWNEGDNLPLISKMHGYHFGSRQMANATVHEAVSPLFTEPFTQRKFEPNEVDFDPDKIYLTFTITDGDQIGVVYRGWESNPDYSGYASLWNDPSRGQIPINWSLNGLMFSFGRGIMRYYYDNASPNDYFVAAAPVGYAWLTYDNFQQYLGKYDAFADEYMQKAGLPAAFYSTAGAGFPPISDSTVAVHTRDLKNADAIIEGYRGGFYQGIYWPENRPEMPYIRTTYAAGVSGYDVPFEQRESSEAVARSIAAMARQVPFRPLFMHVNWINWFLGPSDMVKCRQWLDKNFPGRYEVVTMAQFIALAQKAKRTGQYPLEIYPHPAGDMGLEGPYLWQQKETFTSGKELREHTWRGTRNGFFTYKFNVAPSRRASVSVDLSGDDFHMDVSGDNSTWIRNVIHGSSDQSVTRTVDLTSHINNRGSVYLRFTGDVKVYHIKVDYGL